MACCSRYYELKEQKWVNKEIECQQKIDDRLAMRTVDILLLGTRESGKSTFFKQMRIIHGNGYSVDDLQSHIKFVFQNLFMAMRSMIQAMDKLNILYSTSKNRENGNMIRQVDYETVTTFDRPYVEAINSLWSDDGIQECYDRRREFDLSCSAKYFLDSVERISQPDYLPTIQDILRVRVPTTDMAVHRFEENDIRFRIIDLGDLTSDPRKWIHLFDGIPAVIFFAALNEYDQVAVESDQKNQMEESKALLKTILSSPGFRVTDLILFLNKTDLLEEKIMHSHLVDYYPEFDGPKRDANAAQEFIEKIFADPTPEDQNLYIHFTCAIDTEHTKFLFDCCRESILSRGLWNYRCY